MKKLLLAALVMISAQQTWAQTQTLFNNKGGGKTTIGAFGAPAAQFTSIDGKFGLLTGGYGGVLLNHKIMLGAGAYSIVNNIPVNVITTDGSKQYLNLWYTGLMVQYIHSSDKLIHWTVGALIGGGGVSRRDKHAFSDNSDHEHHTYDGTGFFVAEPTAEIELNITKFLRFDVGASYRYVNGSHTVGITDSKLSGPAVHAGIKAGVF